MNKREISKYLDRFLKEQDSPTIVIQSPQNVIINATSPDTANNILPDGEIPAVDIKSDIDTETPINNLEVPSVVPEMPYYNDEEEVLNNQEEIPSVESDEGEIPLPISAVSRDPDELSIPINKSNADEINNIDTPIVNPPPVPATVPEIPQEYSEPIPDQPTEEVLPPDSMPELVNNIPPAIQATATELPVQPISGAIPPQEMPQLQPEMSETLPPQEIPMPPGPISATSPEVDPMAAQAMSPPQFDPMASQPIPPEMSPPPPVDPMAGQPMAPEPIPATSPEVDPMTGQPMPPPPPQVDPMTGQPMPPPPPQVDPMTGQPMAPAPPQIDPMTGQPLPPPQIDPMTGQPMAPAPPPLPIPIVPPTDIGKVEALKSIQIRLLDLSSILEKFSEERYGHLKEKVLESITVFNVMVANYPTFKEKVLEIAAKYKNFINAIILEIKKIRIKEKEEDLGKKIKKVKSLGEGAADPILGLPAGKSMMYGKMVNTPPPDADALAAVNQEKQLMNSQKNVQQNRTNAAQRYNNPNNPPPGIDQNNWSKMYNNPAIQKNRQAMLQNNVQRQPKVDPFGGNAPESTRKVDPFGGQSSVQPRPTTPPVQQRPTTPPVQQRPPVQPRSTAQQRPTTPPVQQRPPVQPRSVPAAANNTARIQGRGGYSRDVDRTTGVVKAAYNPGETKQNTNLYDKLDNKTKAAVNNPGQPEW